MTKRTKKMKPIDITPDLYAKYNDDFNKKDLKFKVGDHLRISKYKNLFAKGYTPNWSEEVSVVSKIKFLLLVKLKIQFRGPMQLENYWQFL